MSKLRGMYPEPMINVGAISTQGPGYEFITAGDSTALMPVHRQERKHAEKSKPAVELRAGRGPSNYRSDAQAQRDYDDLIADGYTREERARQRGVAGDLAYRAASLGPWLEDLEDATGLDAPYLVDKAADVAALQQEIEYDMLDYASRFKGMPADEVLREYVDEKRRYLNSKGGAAADATRLYKMYPPAE